MSVKRIIPCLDVKDGRVVKGINFEGLTDVASPIDLAKLYCDDGADELCFYDITASTEGRLLFLDVLKEVVQYVTIPLTVGGGISTLDDIATILECGADKVSINSGAIKNPDFIADAAQKYGSERIVMAVDVKRVDGAFRIFTGAGLVDTGLDAIDWIKRGEATGAGELVLNSIDTDGVKGGFDLPLLQAVSAVVSLPIIASGGAGSIDDFITLFETIPSIDAGLAASVFHYGEVSIKDLKKTLNDKSIEVIL
ncbi:MAG: imidazole glycerol phosphate synthase subunit HisF [Oscillospiraceae bacterium]|nr:imidazole glycerol phosphate synthase subunit HisF [Oscillospiraceae bacterium]